MASIGGARGSRHFLPRVTGQWLAVSSFLPLPESTETWPADRDGDARTPQLQPLPLEQVRGSPPWLARGRHMKVCSGGQGHAPRLHQSNWWFCFSGTVGHPPQAQSLMFTNNFPRKPSSPLWLSEAKAALSGPRGLTEAMEEVGAGCLGRRELNVVCFTSCVTSATSHPLAAPQSPKVSNEANPVCPR